MARRITIELTVDEAHALKDAANCLWFAQNDPAEVMAYFGRDDDVSTEIADLACGAADRLDLAIRSSRRGWLDANLRRALGPGD